MLSICCITYNHEKFIDQALTGFSSQVVSFPVELVISDDASTDQTSALIAQFKFNPSFTIKFIQHEKNVGAMHNFVNALNHCSGKYIALCEGDDFWTDPYKLQNQVDVLESNINASACFTNVIFYNEDTHKKDIYVDPSIPSRVYSFDEIVYKTPIHTSTILFRKELLNEKLLNAIEQCQIGDRPLFTYLATKGDMYYLSDITSTYRINSISSWSPLNMENQMLKVIHSYTVIMQLLPEQFHRTINKKISGYYFTLSTTTKNGWIKGYTYLLQCVKHTPDLRYFYGFLKTKWFEKKTT